MTNSVVSREYLRFQQARYFPSLDGLRAVSVLMVLAYHTTDKLWVPLHGYLGVTVFFVISGLLITTLLLREEDRSGKVSIRNFYIRRTFRIFPLYYLALAMFSVLVLVFKLGADPEAYKDRLPLLATYMGEFAGSGTFSHSWSLGIEEKFYLVWPLLGFGFLAVRKYRQHIAVGLLAASIVVAPFPGLNYLSIYTPIIAGCVLAMLLHHERTFEMLRRLAAPVPASFLGVVALVLLIINDEQTYVHIPFALAVTLLMPAFLIGPVANREVLGWKPLAYIGTRAYGIYLFHPLVAAIVEKGLPEGSDNAAVQVLRLLAISAVSLGVADILYRIVEQPLIRLGRRFTAPKPERAVPAGVTS